MQDTGLGHQNVSETEKTGSVDLGDEGESGLLPFLSGRKTVPVWFQWLQRKKSWH